MILADTGIWIDHLNRGDAALAARLERNAVAIHPFVRGEIALGSLRDRRLLEDMLLLPQVAAATDGEVMGLIERRHLHATGIGWVDAHLLAATMLSPDTRLWTRDRRLRTIAGRLGVRTED